MGKYTKTTNKKISIGPKTNQKTKTINENTSGLKEGRNWQKIKKTTNTNDKYTNADGVKIINKIIHKSIFNMINSTVQLSRADSSSSQTIDLSNIDAGSGSINMAGGIVSQDAEVNFTSLSINMKTTSFKQKMITKIFQNILSAIKKSKSGILSYQNQNQTAKIKSAIKNMVSLSITNETIQQCLAHVTQVQKTVFKNIATEGGNVNIGKVNMSQTSKLVVNCMFKKNTVNNAATKITSLVLGGGRRRDGTKKDNTKKDGNMNIWIKVAIIGGIVLFIIAMGLIIKKVSDKRENMDDDDGY